MPYAALSAVYYLTGDLEKLPAAVEKAIQLQAFHEPNIGTVWWLTFLNRIDEAKALALRGVAEADDPYYHLSLYLFAFLQGDTAARLHEIEVLKDDPTWGDYILSNEAATLIFWGQFADSRKLVRRAVAAAMKRDKKEAAAAYQTQAAVGEALVGNSGQAFLYVKGALAITHSTDVQAVSALALSLAGDVAQASRLADGLRDRYPRNTIIQSNYLPTIYAASELQRGKKADPRRAIELLAAAAPYERGVTAFDNGLCFYPAFVRGEAYLAAKDGLAARAEFQKIVDHPGLVVNEPIGSLAHLGLGRAYALTNDSPRAQAEDQSFLSLWKNADSDIPILKQAKVEYERLRSATR